MKMAMTGLCVLVLCAWGISLLGGEKAVSRDYKIRVDRFVSLSEKKSDQASEHILKTRADIAHDLMAQLRDNSSVEAKVYLIYLLGELRYGRAANLLTDHIDLKAPRLDVASAIRRWGPYPAADALTSIGAPAIGEISSRLPKDQTDLRRKLMVGVIWDIKGDKCGRILLEGALAEQTTDPAKANLKASLDAFDSLTRKRQPKP